MARKLVVEVVADISRYVTGLKAAATATGEAAHVTSTLDREVKTLNVDVTKLARTQVEASARSTERLREQAVAYRQIASGAARGSREQVAAARLATEAERKLASATRSTAREVSVLQKESRGLSQIGRGAIAGSGAFKSLRAQVAYASGAYLGGRGLVSVIKSSVQAASDLSEAINKTNVVFGENAHEIEQWAHGSAQNMGLSSKAALETASTFGALFRPMGIVGKQAADQSKQLVQLGADLASFYNTDVNDALEAIQSGLTGQVRPLRRYGVTLSAARVTEEALNETHKKSAKALTEQEKTLARINIIMHDTTVAQGDFRRTSGGLANQERILGASVANLQEKLGKALIPTVTSTIKAINRWLASSKNQREVTRNVKEVVDTLVAALRGLKDAFEFVNRITGSTRNTLKLLFEVFVAFKVLSYVSAFKTMATNIGLMGSAAARATPEVEGLAAAERDAAASGGAGGAAAGGAAAGASARRAAAEGAFGARAAQSGFGLRPAGSTAPEAAPRGGILGRIFGGGRTAAAAGEGLLGGAARLVAGTGLFAMADTKLSGADTANIVKANGTHLKGTKDIYRIGNTFFKVTASGVSIATDKDIQAEALAQIKKNARKAATPIVTDVTSGGYGGGVSTGAPAVTRTAEQRNTFFDQMIQRSLGRVSDLPLQKQLTTLDKVGALLAARFRKTKDVTRQLNLEDQIYQINQQKKGVRQQLAEQFAAGLQLKLQAAELTPGFADDLATLDAIGRNLDKRIAKETDIGKKQDLESLKLQNNAAKAAKRQEAADLFTSQLQFNIDKAGLTKTLNDDIAGWNALIHNLDVRIARETDAGKRLDLENLKLAALQGRAQAVADRRQQAADAIAKAAATRQAKQFKALGLGPGGEDLVPSAAALRKRMEKALEAIAGTKLDTSKVRGMLATIRKILAGAYGKVTNDVRAKILELLQNLFQQVADVKASAKQAAQDAAEKAREARLEHARQEGTGGSGGFGIGAGYGVTAAMIQGRFVGPGGTRAPYVPRPVGRAAPGVGVAVASSYTINGGLNLYGVQNVSEMEQQLQRRSQARSHIRRGPV